MIGSISRMLLFVLGFHFLFPDADAALHLLLYTLAMMIEV